MFDYVSRQGAVGDFIEVHDYQEVTKLSQKKTTQYRSAKTGEFVPRQYAERNPATTVKERNVVQKPSPSKSRGK